MMRNKIKGTTVFVKEHEPIDRALRRFKNKVEDSNLLKELKQREYYEKPKDERKRKKGAARARFLKKQSQQRLPPKNF